MTDTFTWRVHSSASGSVEFSTSSAKFGDGYSQEVPLGLNNKFQKWSNTVSGPAADMKIIAAFLDSHAGATSFFWTPPLGVQGYYKCKKYSPSDQGGGYFTLTMEFEQAFAP